MKIARDRHMQSSAVHSHTQNSHYIGSAFVQPSVYTVNSGITIPSYSQPPIQATHYNPPYDQMVKPQSYGNTWAPMPVKIQYSNEPTSYQVPPPYVP